MKLSKESFEILKNFASMNQSLLFLKGKEQKTMSPRKTILASVELEEEFPQEFGIYDLNQFLGVLSLFDTPTIEFTDKYVEIKKDKQVIRYVFCDEKIIKSPPKDKTIELKTLDVQFELGEDILSSVQNAISLLQLPYIFFEGDGETIFIGGIDPDNDTSNKISQEVGKSDKKFKFFVKGDNFKVLAGAYDVILSKQKLVQFNAKSRSLNYWLPMDDISTFED